ncbi:MAG: outer membrane beta-barrel protein, partial [Pirellulaceae bacterium]|nr:outer membrane beta-barrel protein [Pirellulaceae bacterium]
MNRSTLFLLPFFFIGATVLAQTTPEPQSPPQPSAEATAPAVAVDTANEFKANQFTGCDDYSGRNRNYCRCSGDKSGPFKLRGWIDAGAVWNTDEPSSKFNGPYNAVDRSNEPMLNQIYLIGEKSLPCYGVGVGGRIDILYGEDFFLAESAGLERRDDGSPHWNPEYYGLAIPQAYVSLGNEVANLQIGHFYSIVGYESVMAPENFFYSKAYSYQFAGPFTHWGVQTNLKLNRAWDVQLGLTNGWDALDRNDDQIGYIGKVRYENQSTGIWTSVAATTGDEFNNPAGLAITEASTNRTRYSWLVGLPLTCRTEYVFHHWYGKQKEGAVGGGDARWYGIDQYLYHTINCRWKAG